MASGPALVDTGLLYLYPNYRQPPMVLVRGRGCEVWDSEGRRYLDLYAGIAVSTLGHAHPRLVRAISEQAEKLIHVSNYFYNEPNIRLAEKLCRLTGMERALFSNSGTEAIEAMLKLVSPVLLHARAARSVPDRRFRKLVPRPHARRARHDRTGQVSRRFRTAAGSHARPLRRPRRRKTGDGARRRGDHRRAGAGRRRRGARTGWLPRGPARESPTSTAHCCWPTRSKPASAAPDSSSRSSTKASSRTR